MAELVPGLYDCLVDELLRAELLGLDTRSLRATFAKVDTAELADRVGEVIGRLAKLALAAIPAEDRSSEAVGIVRAVLGSISAARPGMLSSNDMLVDPIERLVAIPARSDERADPDQAASDAIA